MFDTKEKKMIEWPSKYNHQCILEYLEVSESHPIYHLNDPIAVTLLQSAGGALPALWLALAFDCWLARESVRVFRSWWLMLRAWCARTECRTRVYWEPIHIYKAVEAHNRDYISHRSVNRYKTSLMAKNLGCSEKVFMEGNLPAVSLEKTARACVSSTHVIFIPPSLDETTRKGNMVLYIWISN